MILIETESTVELLWLLLVEAIDNFILQTASHCEHPLVLLLLIDETSVAAGIIFFC